MTREVVVEIEGRLFTELKDALFQEDVEQVVFGLASVSNVRIQVEQIRMMRSDAFEVQSAYHVELTDEARRDVMMWAWREAKPLVEFHSHRGYHGVESAKGACFSPTDIDCLRDFAPHVRWRLKGQPYVALVLEESSIDGLAWLRDEPQAEPIVAVVSNGERFETSQESIKAWSRAHA